MGTTGCAARDAMPVAEIEGILLAGMGKFEDACLAHVPFRKGTGSITYIPEQCFVTYFSWELINRGFAVFNEQPVLRREKDEAPNAGGAAPQKTSQRFDLVAMRSSPLAHRSILLKAEAKGNLESGYDQITADIERMEACTVASGICRAHQPGGAGEATFAHHFNIVITQNWGLKELTEWWLEYAPDAPRRRDGDGFRSAEGWKTLKEKLRHDALRRGAVSVLEPGYGYSMDVLYAIFAG